MQNPHGHHSCYRTANDSTEAANRFLRLKSCISMTRGQRIALIQELLLELPKSAAPWIRAEESQSPPEERLTDDSGIHFGLHFPT
jgi:hypothetical protein